MFARSLRDLRQNSNAVAQTHAPLIPDPIEKETTNARQSQRLSEIAL